MKITYDNEIVDAQVIELNRGPDPKVSSTLIIQGVSSFTLAGLYSLWLYIDGKSYDKELAKLKAEREDLKKKIGAA